MPRLQYFVSIIAVWFSSSQFSKLQFFQNRQSLLSCLVSTFLKLPQKDTVFSKKVSLVSKSDQEAHNYPVHQRP